MLIRICFVVIVLVGNASWLAAQQNLGTANLAAPQWEVPIPQAWGQVDPKMCVLDSRYRHQCNHFVSNHSTPFMLQYEWKLNRDEAAISAVPSNRETWTEFALVRKVTLPSKLERENRRPEPRYRLTENYVQYPRSLWFAALAYRYPISQSQEPVVRYQIIKEPTAIAPQYEGMIDCAPPLIARAKTIEALEAKLLEMFCDCVTQMVEEDTQQTVACTKSSNSLEHAPIGWWDLPAASRFR